MVLQSFVIQRMHVRLSDLSISVGQHLERCELAENQRRIISKFGIDAPVIVSINPTPSSAHCTIACRLQFRPGSEREEHRRYVGVSSMWRWEEGFNTQI